MQFWIMDCMNTDDLLLLSFMSSPGDKPGDKMVHLFLVKYGLFE